MHKGSPHPHPHCNLEGDQFLGRSRFQPSTHIHAILHQFTASVPVTLPQEELECTLLGIYVPCIYSHARWQLSYTIQLPVVVPLVTLTCVTSVKHHRVTFLILQQVKWTNTHNLHYNNTYSTESELQALTLSSKRPFWNRRTYFWQDGRWGSWPWPVITFNFVWFVGRLGLGAGVHAHTDGLFIAEVCWGRAPAHLYHTLSCCWAGQNIYGFSKSLMKKWTAKVIMHALLKCNCWIG